jgi:hypothetical protein
LDNLADKAFAVSSVPGFPDQAYLFGQILAILATTPDNAKVVIDFDEDAMRDLFLNLLKSTNVAAEMQGGETDQANPTIYLPSVSAE